MRIGVVAEKLGLTTSAIRYYERQGLIRKVGRAGQAREFDRTTIQTLQFLKLAQSAGFTLKEARKLLDVGFSGARADADWATFIADKQRDVARQKQDLNRMDRLLTQFADCTCPSLDVCMGQSDCLGIPPQKPTR